ncbi:MAG: ARMT1-like domain-containing protein [Candidatus Omnitrophica bacterium]|nr:ARMT1-like domain-containing protein [Candidatus Omnitrophota bacterium]MDD5775521.1 ARMT1-like domain-containing protein [Candidatus Omnitrophota bacterium]
MKTCLDCIPCFFRQMLEATRLIGASPKQQKRVIDAFAKKIPGLSLQASPPEIAQWSYRLLKKVSFRADPYLEIKRKSNRCAMRLFGKLKDKVERSQDRLLTAVELAIAGNIIDFGAKNNLDVKEELKKILEQEQKAAQRRSLFHYAEFRRVLKAAKNILYLADNAGEIVFDRILIEEMKKEYQDTSIVYAVKAKPVINDALMEDAHACGIHKSARVVSNGADAPGTILAACSKEFRRLFASADMIISKGQGNFESLSAEKRPIFFLFMVKCPVVAQETGCKMGSIVLLFNKRG